MREAIAPTALHRGSGRADGSPCPERSEYLL